ncbi:MAG TPA: alpha/beta hydrolase [Chitinophagaceae bacterium]|nr:alpha/beta hydrolase [Chitinophagaceae bacterium]
MQAIVLLHGATGSKEQFGSLVQQLNDQYRLHCINFSGHGGEMMPGNDFSIPAFAEDVLRYLDQQGLKKVHLLGYSMGGYVALHLASHHPGRIEKIITLATKFYWDETIAAREAKLLDPKKIEEKVPAFARQLKQRHGDDRWEMLLFKTAALLNSLGKNPDLKTEDFARIELPVLLLLGDRDNMVTLEETLAVFKQLKAGQLGILPGTGHLFEQVDLQRLIFEIKQFIN